MGLLNYFGKLLSRTSSGRSLYLAPGSSNYLPSSISATSALRVATAYACVSITAQAVASLPIRFFKKDGKGNREIINDDPAYFCLAFRPNPFQSAFEFHEMMAASVMLRGVAYARIYRNARGQVVELLPLPAEVVKPSLNDAGADIVYKVLINGREEILPKEKILHIRGLHSDLLNPISPISHAAAYMYLDGNLFQHESANFGPNAARPGGLIETDNKISEPAAKRLLDIFNKKYAGPGNAGATLLLDQGMHFKPIQFSNEDAQFLAMREMSIEDICRIFNVPPSLVHHNKNSTFSNSEQQALSYVKFCLRPLLNRMETAYANCLFLDPKELTTTEIYFDAAPLLKGDMASISTFLTRLVSGGIATPNEARIMAGLDRMDVEGADSLYMMQNTIPIENIESSTEGQTTNAVDNSPTAQAELNPAFSSAINELLSSIAGDGDII